MSFFHVRDNGNRCWVGGAVWQPALIADICPIVMALSPFTTEPSDGGGLGAVLCFINNEPPHFMNVINIFKNETVMILTERAFVVPC